MPISTVWPCYQPNSGFPSSHSSPSLTQIEGRVPLTGEVIDVGDPEGLDGDTTDAQQRLGNEHDEENLVVLPGGMGGAAGIAEVPLGPRHPGLAQVGGVAEHACDDKGSRSKELGLEKELP